MHSNKSVAVLIPTTEGSNHMHLYFTAIDCVSYIAIWLKNQNIHYKCM